MVDIEDVAREIWRAMEGISDGDGKALLRGALAEAWSEGFDSAAETSGIEYGDNPYREDAEAKQDAAARALVAERLHKALKVPHLEPPVFEGSIGINLPRPTGRQP